MRFESFLTFLFFPKARGCVDILYAGFSSSGVYTINSDRRTEFEVYCDLETDKGGWIVFQRRLDASVSFHRNWEDYKRGFGNLKGNRISGLEMIKFIVSPQQTKWSFELILKTGMGVKFLLDMKISRLETKSRGMS